MGPISEKRREIEQKTGRYKLRRPGFAGLTWEDMEWVERLVEKGLQAVGLYSVGFKNLYDLRIERLELEFERLPEAFDGIRLLWLSDFHIEPLEGFPEVLWRVVEPLTFDIAVLGGDCAFHYDLTEKAVKEMRKIVEPLLGRACVYGILGNHDRYEMGRILEEWGVRMLVNENERMERDGQFIYLAGVDDCHYYEGDDLAGASEGIPNGSFSVLFSHSPEIIHKTDGVLFDMCLCGHTHGGQVCLPNGFPPVICSSVSRRFAKGLWKKGGMVGYTSRGIGVSGIPVRFFCPPEITLLTFRKKNADSGSMKSMKRERVRPVVFNRR
jgi:hypothetical protein